MRRRIACIFPNGYRFYSNNKGSQLRNTPVFYVEKMTGDYSGITLFRLCRPETKNALNGELLNGLKHAIDVAVKDINLRAIVIKSDCPDSFCAGADLKERSTLNDLETRLWVRRTRNIFDELANLEVPVLAAIDGVALGGGLELALACDIRVASENAKMGLVETRLAIIPGAGGTQRLPRIIGVARAKELMFTGRILSASEAFHWGLLNHLVRRCDTDMEKSEPAFTKCLEIAAEILTRGPVAVKMVKQAVHTGMQMDIKRGLIVEDLCYAQVIPTQDRLEGLKAFKEKRKPVFLGC